MTENINKFPVIQYIHSGAIVVQNKCSKVDRAIDQPFTYVKNFSKILQNICKIPSVAHRIGTKFPAATAAKINRVIVAIGLLNVIEIFRIILQTPGNILKFASHIGKKDAEGIFWGAGSLLITPADILDNLCTVIKALANLGRIPVIKFFGAISLPIAVATSGYYVIKGYYDIIMLVLHRTRLETDETKIFKYLDKTLGERSWEVVKSDKINRLERRTDKKIVNMMKRLHRHLYFYPEDMETAKLVIKDIKSLYTRKIVVNTISNLALTALFGALLTACFTPVAPAAIPGILASKYAVSLAKRGFNDFLGTRWLNKKSWVN